jgi:selenocysteine lyase/cysteine desulfurase
MPSPSRRGFVTSLFALSAAPWARADATQALTGLVPADDFLLAPGLVYLQTGSLGPTPRPVIEQTLAAWKELEQNPVLQAYRQMNAAGESVRSKAAALLGATVGETVVTRSTTEGMNAVALGIDLLAGDHVLTTDQEHPGGRWCWDYLARKRGVVLDTVAIPPGENDAGAIVERFRKALTARTRVVSFSHILSSTGLRMPAREIAAIVQAHGSLSIVDGAQAAGGIEVDVRAIGCDVYATSGHKWLLGPKGTGLLYIADRAAARVDLVNLQAGRAVHTDSTGMTSVPDAIGLGAAIDYLTHVGMPRVFAHNLALRDRVVDGLLEMPRVRLVSARRGPLASPLVTIELPKELESRAFIERLRERYRVVLKMVPKNWFNGIRFSTHVFNSVRDVDRALEAVRAELE